MLLPQPDVVLMAGDLSYADGWGWRWDSYGRMVQRLAANVPVMTTVGNHEVVASEQFVHYNARYPMPAESSKSPSNTYWSMDMYGVHVVTLNTYAALKKGSTQQQWLWQDLQNVDRTVTPWIIVMMHVPLYNSNEKHWGEQYFLLHQLEDVLYHAGVDLVISGHVHAYERSYPVYKQAESVRPVYLTVRGQPWWHGWVVRAAVVFGLSRVVVWYWWSRDLQQHACSFQLDATCVPSAG